MNNYQPRRRTMRKVSLGRWTIRFRKWTWYIALVRPRLPRLVVSGPWTRR